MTWTKEKSNTLQQRTLLNDERPFKGSNGHEADINGCQWLSFLILRLMRPLWALSHECRMVNALETKGPVTRVPHGQRRGQRMKNECHFFGIRWYPSKMRIMPVWSFDCMFVIRYFALFVRVIFLLCQRHSFFMRSTSFVPHGQRMRNKWRLTIKNEWCWQMR